MPTESIAWELDPHAGFQPQPNTQNRIGYVTTLTGFNEAVLKADLQVFVPYDGATIAYTGMHPAPNPASPSGRQIVTVVGVLEHFEWDGSVGGQLKIDFWCSQENATQLKTAQQSTLTTTRINQLGWWICNFDQATKVWYEQSYPAGGHITGSVTAKPGPDLDPVVLSPEPATFGNKQLYHVLLPVTPAAADVQSLIIASSPTMKTTRPWGIQVGTFPTAEALWRLNARSAGR
jgi:hypothetical protein